MNVKSTHVAAAVGLLVVAATGMLVRPKVGSASSAETPPSVAVGLTPSICSVKVFDEADHATPSGVVRTFDQQPSDCLDSLARALVTNSNALIVLSGRVDKREMRLPRRRHYGDSLSLAYQRALTVREALLDEYESATLGRGDRRVLEARIIPMPAGASNVGLSVSGPLLSDDRSVDIRAYWVTATIATNPEGQDDAPTGEITMFTSGDKLTLLTLIVALSAYLASVRLAAIGRLSALSRELSKDIYGTPLVTDSNKAISRRKDDIGRSLKWLTLSDAPMIASGFLLGLHIFYAAGERALMWSVYLFTFGGIVLMLLHGLAWVKTFSRSSP